MADGDDYEQDLVDFDYDVDAEEDSMDERGDAAEEKENAKNEECLVVPVIDDEPEAEVEGEPGKRVLAFERIDNVVPIDSDVEEKECRSPQEEKESRSPKAASEALQSDGPDLEDGEFADPAMFQEKEGRKVHADGRPGPCNNPSTSGDEAAGMLGKAPLLRRKGDRLLQGQQANGRNAKRGDDGAIPGGKRPRHGHTEYRGSSLLAGSRGGGQGFPGGFRSPMEAAAGHFGPGMLGRGGGQLPLEVQMALYNASMGGGMGHPLNNGPMGGGHSASGMANMQDFVYQMSILRGQHMAQDLLARQTARQPRPGLNGGPSLRSPHPGISPSQILAPPRGMGVHRSSLDPPPRSHHHNPHQHPLSAASPLTDLANFRTHVHNGMILLEPRHRERQGSRHSDGSSGWQESPPEGVMRRQRGRGAGILDPPPFPPGGGSSYRSSRWWDAGDGRARGGLVPGETRGGGGEGERQHYVSRRGAGGRSPHDEYIYKGSSGGSYGLSGRNGSGVVGSLRREAVRGSSRDRDRKRKAEDSDGEEGAGRFERGVGKGGGTPPFRPTIRSKVGTPPGAEKGGGGYALSPPRMREGSFDERNLPPPPPMPEGGLPHLEGRERLSPAVEEGGGVSQERTSPGVIQLGGPKMKSRTLMVSGLPAGFSLSSVVTAFEQQGKVTDFSRKDVNFFITYDSVADAVAAQRSFHRSALGGNLITVGYAATASGTSPDH